MIEARGYWLSVRTEKSANESEDASHTHNSTTCTVKIHGSESSAIGMAEQYVDALAEFKKSLILLRKTSPDNLPVFDDFNSNTMQENVGTAMAFLSEDDIDLAV